ncbi:hypothetical protein BJY04DRAFT_216652 [Aspergillus karnatakaensis]|uniref:uncharacterized protein n=1 Tax=Aspergillus karnatakaensis TaxID=1810916 RepID=UPI003CCCD633
MLSDFMQSSYARYKTDTNTLATWLLDTACQCGYQPSILSTPVLPTKKGKKKGKRDASDTSPVSYNVTTKDLQNLARVVADSTLTVPKSVFVIAKRAIKLRKSITAWFLGQGDSADNKRHAHFITVLEQICETLEWKVKQASKPDVKEPPTPISANDQSDDADADTDTFLNKFAVLTVEEPQDDGQAQPAAVGNRKIAKVTVVEEDDNEAADPYLGHLFFKTYCLLQDLNYMRKFLSNTWSEYRDGKIDLMNAAVVSDSALQLARDLVKDVEADWGSSLINMGENVQSIVYKLAGLNRGISGAPSSEIGLPYNKNMADVADWCYVPTKILLESFADVLQDNHLPVFKRGYFGTYNPKSDRERMSLSQKFNEDKIILLSILPEFCMLDTFKIQMPTADVITRGIAEFARTKKVTLWLCFASQIFLDVHHIMRHSPLGAFGDLRMSGLRIQKTINDYLNLSKTHPPPTFWPREGDKEIQSISTAVDSWIIQDLFQEIRQRSGIDRVGSPPEKHILLSQHFILCGLVLFNLNLRMQFVGQQLISQWYDVQQLAFLHNLVIASPMQKYLPWPDMDAFIKIHGESHIFVGARPKNATESLQRLELATGISSPVAIPETKGNFTSPTAKMPDGPEGVDSSHVGLASFDKILNELVQKRELQSSSSKELQKANPELTIARAWSTTHNIDTLHLLALLKTKLFEEEPIILYNYFGMHKRAIELLRLTRDKEHAKFSQYFTSAYLPDESFISNIVILIHHVARGSALNARQFGIGGGGDSVCSRIVMSAADVMRGYLEKNGAVAVKELRVFCKNKTPIQDDHTYDQGQDKMVYSWFSLEDVVGAKGVASLMTGIPIA